MQTKSKRQVQPGDVVVVHGHALGHPGRTGVVLEVLDPASGHEHYRVRWDEEHESLYWPGSDATFRPGTRRHREPLAVRPRTLAVERARMPPSSTDGGPATSVERRAAHPGRSRCGVHGPARPWRWSERRSTWL